LALSGYGTNSNVTINQTAVDGQVLTVGAGSLATPTLKTGSGYSPVSQFVVGESTFTTGIYNFVSTNGASVISEMTFAASGTAANITNVSVGGISAPMINNEASLTGLTLNIPVSNGGTNVPVIVTYATVGNNGVTSNATSGLMLTGYKFTSGNTTTSTSSKTVSTNLMTLVGSKPTVVFNDISRSAVVSGVQEIARVTVSADAKGEVKLITLPLSVTTSGTTGAITSSTSTYKVYANGTLLTNGTDYTNTLGVVGTSTTATGTITFAGTGYSIAAGGAGVVFKVYANVTVNADKYDGISSSIGANTLFTWNDVVGGVSNITGEKILNYPSTEISQLTY
jgi:hypothetical protein